VAAVATHSTPPHTRDQSQAQAGDTGDNESNNNQEIAVRSARRPDGFPENATWQQ